MNSIQLQVLDFTYDYPVIYDFTKNLMNVNYRKQFNSIMDGIETALIWIAAIVIVLYRKWNEYNCNERLQLFALNVKDFSVKTYTWFRQIGVPAIVTTVNVTYRAGVQIRRLYDLISSPLFITL